MNKQAIPALAVAVLLVTNASLFAYSGGDGSAENPYKIATPNDMNEIGANPGDWGSHFVMVNDVNLADITGTQFNIIGNITTPFTGVFDGNNHKLFNFTYHFQTTSENDVGLFGLVDDPTAIITNVQFIEPNVDAGWGNNVGVLVAHLNSGTVVNCRVQGGTVSGDHSVGGLVGRASNAEVANCSTATTVSGKGFFAGGLIANIAHGLLSNNYSVGEVAGSSYVGGLVGLFSSGGLFHNCYSTGKVSGTEYLGGFVGRHWDNGSYNKCFWDSTVNPSLDGIGNRTDPNVIGKSTIEMKKESTFTNAGWDFIEIWNIGENQTYPYLRVYPAGDLNHDGRVDFFDFAIVASHWLEGI